MEKRQLIIVVCIIVMLIGIFLYYKNKPQTEWLQVVPNAQVATKIRPKKKYKLVYNPGNPGTIIFATGFTVPSVGSAVILTDYTNANCSKGTIDPTCPIMSTRDTGISCVNMKSLNIYNASPDAFNIIGITTTAEEIPAEPNSKISMTIGSRDGNTKLYDGNKVSISAANQIKFSNISEYILKRIIIICNNVLPRSLYIYFINSVDQTGGIRINNLTDDILLIDLYNSV